MSFVCALYHIVINTKHRAFNIPDQYADQLYAYIAGIIKHNHSEPIIINGVANHLHILLKLSATVALSDLMKSIKQSSSLWMHNKSEFRKFDSWGKEYFATTFSYRQLDALKNYVSSQREHHTRVDYGQELRRILESYGGEWCPWMDN